MNIFITGASRGIGFDTALALAKNKAHTVFAVSRNKTGLHNLLKKANQNGLNIEAFDLDLHNFDEIAIRHQLSGCGQIDVLINNAGRLINNPFVDLNLDDIRDMFETNFFGPIKVIKYLLPLLKKSPNAHIVNIGSMGGVQGSKKFLGLSGYSASKAALANLTECLAEELKPFKISVNCLALGAVNTEMLRQAFPDYTAPINSAEMANFIADFSLNFHKYFNGKIVPVSLATP